MGDWFSSVVAALLRTSSLSASITPSRRQNQLSSGCHEIPMRWNKGMRGVFSNGWNEELVKALHTFDADLGTDGCLISQKHVLQFPSALSIITAHAGVRPDRYDEDVTSPLPCLAAELPLIWPLDSPRRASGIGFREGAANMGSGNTKVGLMAPPHQRKWVILPYS
ncbi:hypothetical protein EV363DRAFT_1377847 [Boletus edulis]|nr:hypothetical protein EV363DRAFT_1377847 [Boletus edulis]